MFELQSTQKLVCGSALGPQHLTEQSVKCSHYHGVCIWMFDRNRSKGSSSVHAYCNVGPKEHGSYLPFVSNESKGTFLLWGM